MARVLLIMPHLPQRMGAPYLGQQYLAASLLAAGHEVKCVDQAAVLFTGGDDAVVAEAQDFGPDLIGVTLFTLNARRGYLLAGRLRGVARLLVAGGPHPTVRPREALGHGFDLSLMGEGELALVALADWLDRGGARPAIAGLHLPSGEGTPGLFLDDLDALPFPHESYRCFDPAVYSAEGMVIAGSVMTSRGCPARCTFCANYVTGRGYRWRSAGDVIAELRILRERHGVMHFAFLDDAFTARRPRLEALCDAIASDPVVGGSTWSCITPANMVKPRDLARMRAAGCVSINFGIESGDEGILKQIQKGQRPEQVFDAVRAARAEGMSTVVNFMFGFPGEGLPELERTLAFMERLSEYADFFNNRGVLVPFPGTPIYERYHRLEGFTDWWLRPEMVPDEQDLVGLGAEAVQEYLEMDPALDLGFFDYPDAVRDKIRACVRFKARHNQMTLERQREYWNSA